MEEVHLTMSLVTVCVLACLVTGQNGPPTRLTDLVRTLGASGLDVTVSDVDGHGWEVWCESRGPVSDAKLARLNGQREINSVRLLEGGFSDEGVAHLKRMPALHTLVLVSDQLTDKCTLPISRLKGLVKLDLNRARLTKVGLARLESLPRLERLYLYNATVPEQDFLALRGLKGLKVLSLPKAVEPSVIAKLRKSMPGTDISQV